MAGTIATRFGSAGVERGRVRLRFLGSAGQSFGAFATHGMQLDLEGQANDYVGKGLAGGEITLRPFRQAGYAQQSQDHVIIGNTCLYGATEGLLFAAGQAGSRFAVRNSGATAVIEGAGNHCCEYMTGGTVVVLGTTGRNFGAGMTHGAAYVLDEAGSFPLRCNLESVTLEALGGSDETELFALISEHLRRTGSTRARTILEGWTGFRLLFHKVIARPAKIDSPVAAPDASVVVSR